MKVKLIKLEGKIATFELPVAISKRQLVRKSNQGQIMASLEFEDSRFITPDQRRKIYGLFKDIANHSGYESDFVKSEFKKKFAEIKEIEPFSLADGCMSLELAKDFITYIIQCCFYLGIPFYERAYYLDADDQKILFLYTMNRRCICCGKYGADIHHVDAVGMGADRNKVDHRKHLVMALCREHHSEYHTIGAERFLEKWHLPPGIKLDDEQLRRIKIRGEYDDRGS